MNLDTLFRVYLGRALITASRRMSRAGARLLGHPSGGAAPLRSVPTDAEIVAHCVGGKHDPRVTSLVDRLTEKRSAP